MKTLLPTLLAVLVGLFVLPEQAVAGHGHHVKSSTYCSSHSACGCPVYTRKVIVSYDCHHRPVYRYYKVPMVHRCSTHYRHSYRRSHHRPHHRYHAQPSRHHNHHGRHHSVSYRSRYGSISFCR